MNTETKTLTGIEEDVFFKSIITKAVSENLGIALFRNPNTASKNIVAGNITQFNNEQIENGTSGFLFHPYKKEEKGFLINVEFVASFDDAAKIEKDKYGFDTLDFEDTTQDLPFYYNDVESTYRTDNSTYTDYVLSGIEAIKAGKLQKVVPSRSKHIDLPEAFNPVDTFLKLCATYPRAFVSVVSIPEAGTWLGATPELLLETTSDGHFKTVALAGTQKYDGSSSLSAVAWTQKEIEEQALVSRYIINCFKKIRLREFSENGPKTVIAGNLIHLKTTFEVDMKATNFQQLGSVMLELLHPTSAVCGMPIEEAEKFINEYEGDNRKFYSGFLGPINMNSSTSIYVNLRCMQLHNQGATIYAGGGLTEDSDPKKEWQETELKMNTLLNVINQ